MSAMENQLSTTALVIIAASGGVGALVAGLVSALVNWMTESGRRKHEHAAWLREKKLAAYSEFASSARALDAFSLAGLKASKEMIPTIDAFNQRFYEIEMLMETERLREFQEHRKGFGIEEGRRHNAAANHKAMTAMLGLMREDLMDTK